MSWYLCGEVLITKQCAGPHFRAVGTADGLRIWSLYLDILREGIVTPRGRDLQAR